MILPVMLKARASLDPWKMLSHVLNIRDVKSKIYVVPNVGHKESQKINIMKITSNNTNLKNCSTL